MRGQAMKQVCSQLEVLGEPLSKYRALEFFARSGDWQTVAYAHKVKTLTAWEIDPMFEPQLRLNFPSADITIGDSFMLANKKDFKHAFEFIVIDNPQGIYGKYCEHFEALNLLPNLMSRRGVVVFNVNRKPFNYSHDLLWQKRRHDYYKMDASNMDVDYLLEYYEKIFSELLFRSRFSFEVKRNNEYLSYLVFGLERV